MKEPKQKAQIKSAKKAARNEIQARLVVAIKAIFEEDKIKLTKKIEKKAEKLTKVLAKELNFSKPEVTEAPKEAKAKASPKAKAPAKVKAVTPVKATGTAEAPITEK